VDEMRLFRKRIDHHTVALGKNIYKHLKCPLSNRYIAKDGMPWSEFVKCVEDYLDANGISRDTPVFAIDVQEVEIGSGISVYMNESLNQLYITDMNQ
jgi:hypothetical protein